MIWSNLVAKLLVFDCPKSWFTFTNDPTNYLEYILCIAVVWKFLCISTDLCKICIFISPIMSVNLLAKSSWSFISVLLIAHLVVIRFKVSVDNHDWFFFICDLAADQEYTCHKSFGNNYCNTVILYITGSIFISDNSHISSWFSEPQSAEGKVFSNADESECSQSDSCAFCQ